MNTNEVSLMKTGACIFESKCLHKLAKVWQFQWKMGLTLKKSCLRRLGAETKQLTSCHFVGNINSSRKFKEAFLRNLFS